MADMDSASTPGSGRDSDPPATPLRLLQLTDLHLYGDPERRLLGQDTRATFESVLTLAQARHWPPDALLLTGDLVHDEAAAGYRFLRDRLLALGLPFHCIPGNHDRLDLLVGHLDATAVSAMRVVRAGAWDLILLDSTTPGEEGGHLDASILRGLAEHRRAAVGRPTLIVLHHHLTPIRSGWIDTMLVDNGEEVLVELRQHPDLRGVLCGHVHQRVDQVVDGLRLLATPSTCVQFEPLSEQFRLDPATPGYRWIDLYADGHFETGIERTDAYPHPLSPNADGGY
jgi:Icc protein